MYDRAAATAIRLLDKYGQSATVTRVTEGQYDPSTGTVEQVEQAFPCMAVVVPYNIAQVDGALVQSTDMQAYVSPYITATPEPGDTLTLANGKNYTIVRSSPLAPAGTVVLHQLQVRA